jgi:hypothetical protein
MNEVPERPDSGRAVATGKPVSKRQASRSLHAEFGQGAWVTFANGWIYRPVMRFMHRLGWCWPTPSPIEPGYVWCHWCGMRGKKPTTKHRPEDD